eukprot:g2356.t1
MDVKTWLAKIRPGLAAYEGVFRDQDFYDTDDIFLMKPENIADILSKCDAQGITAGLRNKLEHALEHKVVFQDSDGEEEGGGAGDSKIDADAVGGSSGGAGAQPSPAAGLPSTASPGAAGAGVASITGAPSEEPSAAPPPTITLCAGDRVYAGTECDVATVKKLIPPGGDDSATGQEAAGGAAKKAIKKKANKKDKTAGVWKCEVEFDDPAKKNQVLPAKLLVVETPVRLSEAVTVGFKERVLRLWREHVGRSHTIGAQVLLLVDEMLRAAALANADAGTMEQQHGMNGYINVLSIHMPTTILGCSRAMGSDRNAFLGHRSGFSITLERCKSYLSDAALLLWWCGSLPFPMDLRNEPVNNTTLPQLIVPSEPESYIPEIRRAEADRLVEALSSAPAAASKSKKKNKKSSGDGVAAPIVGVVAVKAMGGIGKSWLAKHVAWHPRIIERYPDGIFWIQFGEEMTDAQLLMEQSKLIRDLGGAAEGAPSLDHGREEIKRLLHLVGGGLREGKVRRCLLIVDDVWKEPHLRKAFPKGILCGDEQRILVTTRDAGTLINHDARRFELATLEPAASLVLLGEKIRGLRRFPLLPESEDDGPEGESKGGGAGQHDAEAGEGKAAGGATREEARGDQGEGTDVEDILAYDLVHQAAARDHCNRRTAIVLLSLDGKLYDSSGAAIREVRQRRSQFLQQRGEVLVVDTPDPEQARRVAELCGHLPLGLAMVGSALRNQLDCVDKDDLRGRQEGWDMIVNILGDREGLADKDWQALMPGSALDTAAEGYGAYIDLLECVGASIRLLGDEGLARRYMDLVVLVEDETFSCEVLSKLWGEGAAGAGRGGGLQRRQGEHRPAVRRPRVDANKLWQRSLLFRHAESRPGANAGQEVATRYSLHDAQRHYMMAKIGDEENFNLHRRLVDACRGDGASKGRGGVAAMAVDGGRQDDDGMGESKTNHCGAAGAAAAATVAVGGNGADRGWAGRVCARERYFARNLVRHLVLASSSADPELARQYARKYLTILVREVIANLDWLVVMACPPMGSAQALLGALGQGEEALTACETSDAEFRTGFIFEARNADGSSAGWRAVSAGSEDNTLRIWDLDRGEAVGEPLQGHTDSVSAVSVFEARNADGSSAGWRAVSGGSGDNTLRIWDLDRGEAVGEPLQGHTGGVIAVSVFEA